MKWWKNCLSKKALQNKWASAEIRGNLHSNSVFRKLFYSTIANLEKPRRIILSKISKIEKNAETVILKNGQKQLPKFRFRLGSPLESFGIFADAGKEAFWNLCQRLCARSVYCNLLGIFKIPTDSKLLTQHGLRYQKPCAVKPRIWHSFFVANFGMMTQQIFSSFSVSIIGCQKILEQ